MTSWADATAKFAEALPGFQRRENQDRLAVKIETSFETGRHLFAQAGCGTGKSFAGLIPAIAQSKRTGQPVILATATKALQDQYAEKDLPFLQTVLGDFSFTVLKGRSNYVCLAKLNEMDDKFAATEVTKAMDEEAFNGEIESLGAEIAPQTKAQLSTSSDECPGKADCPFGKQCFANLAKDRAKQSNIVVVNHAVLAADLSIKEAQRNSGVPEEKITGVLPDFGGVVVDEAHEMDNYVTNALGGEVTGGSYHRLGTLTFNLVGDRSVVSDMDQDSDALFREVQRLLDNREDRRSRTRTLGEQELVVLSPYIEKLYKTLSTLTTKVANFQVHGDDKAVQQQRRLLKRLQNASERLLQVLVAESDELVRWVELGEGKKGVTIQWAPLSVAEFLARTLLAKAPVTFMSATLALGNDFSYLAEELGVEEYDGFDAGTPFDFQTQARTFVPQIAAPQGAQINQWRSASTAIMGELLRASNGRALLLFTSKTEMEEAYRALAPIVTRMGHKALKQGDAPNKVLSKQFKDDEHSVLFGLDSFMTGIDIQGDSLRLVVINKLPFPVPSDVIFKARTDAVDRKYGAWQGFNRLSVPAMALKLQQAYGRLIRTVNDQGVVAILDSRLYAPKGSKGNSKPYGGRIMKSLPDAPVVTELAEVTSYLESLEVTV